MYFFWWNKPLDVHSTIALYDSEKPTSNQRVDEILIQGNDEAVDENGESNRAVAQL